MISANGPSWNIAATIVPLRQQRRRSARGRRGRFSVQAPLHCSPGSCIACRRCAHVLSEVVCGFARCGMPVLCFHPSFATRGKYVQAFFFPSCSMWRLIPDVSLNRLGVGGAQGFYYNNKHRHICFVFSSLKDFLQLYNLTGADSHNCWGKTWQRWQIWISWKWQGA